VSDTTGGDGWFTVGEKIFTALFAPLHFLITQHFMPVFWGNQQHAKTFSFFFLQVLVVHLVCPAYGAYVQAAAAGKPFKPLVNDYVMHQKVSEAIHCYAKTDGCCPVSVALQAQHNAEPAWYGKNEEESIVFFKKPWSFLVVIFVEVPQKAVHHIAVCEPCDAFHEAKSG
jgi:hypothetical protein